MKVGRRAKTVQAKNKSRVGKHPSPVIEGYSNENMVRGIDVLCQIVLFFLFLFLINFCYLVRGTNIEVSSFQYRN